MDNKDEILRLLEGEEDLLCTMKTEVWGYLIPGYVIVVTYMVESYDINVEAFTWKQLERRYQRFLDFMQQEENVGCDEFEAWEEVADRTTTER